MVAMHVRVEVEADSDVPGAADWLEQLKNMLNNLSDGVTITCKPPADEIAYVRFGDVLRFLQERNVAIVRRRTNARAIIAWLVKHMRDRLFILCNACLRPMDELQDEVGCRCTDRGYRIDREWYYKIGHPDLAKGEDDWSIGVNGLVQLARRPQDIQSERLPPNARRRILWYLNYVMETYASADN